MSRPIELVIHMDALRHNCQKMREAARGRFLWAVVKANGYGHGLEHIVKGSLRRTVSRSSISVTR